ncbi:hypothetical protein KIPB_010752, partial [Kipferlia bialata]
RASITASRFLMTPPTTEDQTLQTVETVPTEPPARKGPRFFVTPPSIKDQREKDQKEAEAECRERERETQGQREAEGEAENGDSKPKGSKVRFFETPPSVAAEREEQKRREQMGSTDSEALPHLPLSLYTSDSKHEIPLSTPVGLLRVLRDPSVSGPLVLRVGAACTETETETEGEGEDEEETEEERETETPAPWIPPTLTSSLIATLPGLDIDPSTAIFNRDIDIDALPTTGACPLPPVVTVLSKCRRALITMSVGEGEREGEVLQVIGVGKVPASGESDTEGSSWVRSSADVLSAVSTQGGVHHLLRVRKNSSVSTSAVSYAISLHRVAVVHGVAEWREVDALDVDKGLYDALSGSDDGEWCCSITRDNADGSLVVVARSLSPTRHLGTYSYFRLDTTAETPSICPWVSDSMLWLRSAISADCVRGVSVCGDIVSVTLGDGESILTHTLERELQPETPGKRAYHYLHWSKTLSVAECTTTAVGTVFRPLQSGGAGGSDNSLCMAVRDSTCVPLPVSVVQYSVCGRYLLYTDPSSSLRVMDLSPLLECPLLSCGSESQALPDTHPVPWVQQPSATQPFPPTLQCTSGNRLVTVALESESMQVVGVAEYNCARCTWSVTRQPKSDARTLSLATDKAVVVEKTLYACVRGELVSATLAGSASTTLTHHGIVLSGQPRLCIGQGSILLPTPAGLRELSVGANPGSLGGIPITHTSAGGVTAGACIDGACIEGVVTSALGCYCVKGGVWRSMPGTPTTIPDTETLTDKTNLDLTAED